MSRMSSPEVMYAFATSSARWRIAPMKCGKKRARLGLVRRKNQRARFGRRRRHHLRGRLKVQRRKGRGGRRKGAACVYLETWHADIEEFLELRDNVGDTARRTLNLNLANWVEAEFVGVSVGLFSTMGSATGLQAAMFNTVEHLVARERAGSN